MVEDPQTKEITDMISFYTLNLTVIANPKYSSISAVYSFYNAFTKTPQSQLMYDALILAKKLGFDVFITLDLQNNSTILKDHIYTIGSDKLRVFDYLLTQYYLFNYRMSVIPASDVGLVLF